MNKVLENDLNNIIEQQIDWEKLRNKTIMITGASGMVGSYFVRTLLKLNEVNNMNIHVVCVLRDVKK